MELILCCVYFEFIFGWNSKVHLLIFWVLCCVYLLHHGIEEYFTYEYLILITSDGQNVKISSVNMMSMFNYISQTYHYYNNQTIIYVSYKSYKSFVGKCLNSRGSHWRIRFILDWGYYAPFFIKYICFTNVIIFFIIDLSSLILKKW